MIGTAAHEGFEQAARALDVAGIDGGQRFVVQHFNGIGLCAEGLRAREQTDCQEDRQDQGVAGKSSQVCCVGEDVFDVRDSTVFSLRFSPCGIGRQMAAQALMQVPQPLAAARLYVNRPA
jgi:hypothetical protein